MSTGEGLDGRARPATLGAELRVHRVIAETDDAVSIEFDAQDAMPYRPGQFLTVRVPAPEPDRFLARCYSLSSAPETDTRLRMTVKRQGWCSNWICDNVTAGSRIRVLPPTGTFTLDENVRKVFFVAAGSGITPIISMIKSVLVRPGTQVVLHYVNRSRESVIFSDELSELERCHPERFAVWSWISRERGRPTRADIAATTDLGEDWAAYLCGPTPFVDTMTRAVLSAGLHADRVHHEQFLSLELDPFVLLRPDAADAAPGAGPVELEVDLDGVVDTAPCPPGSSLLDAVLAAGMDPPYSCREGTCGTCIARVTSGVVDHRRAPALSAQDRDAGYTLTCRAVPASARVGIEF